MDRAPLVVLGSLVLGLVVAATLVRLLARERRARLRRLSIFVGLFAVGLALELALSHLGAPVWARRIALARDVLEAFSWLNLAALGLFDLVLPRLRVRPSAIAAEVGVGVGYAVSLVGVLTEHGFSPASVLGASAVVSAVLALSLQSTLGNIIGGVALQIDGSLKVGDWVELDNGRQGRVTEIRWRHTLLETRDWNVVVVPNAQLLAGQFIVLGQRGGQRVPQRITVHFNVDHRIATARVLEVVDGALRDAVVEGVAADPRPNVVAMDLGHLSREGYTTYTVRYWLLDPGQVEPTSSRVRARIHSALARAGIPLARPTRDNELVVLDAERESKKRDDEIAKRLEVLRQVVLFAEMKEEELRHLAAGLSRTVHERGETITRQGAVAHWLYLLVAGSVEVRLKAEGADTTHTVATLSAPDFFGEMGLMTGERRRADVVARTFCECLRLDKATFQEVLSARPEVVSEISTRLAQRQVGLHAAANGKDDRTRKAEEERERDRIVGAIRSFFGLG